MFRNCCIPNRADIVEEGKEETMSHSNIFPTFTILDEAKAKPLMEKCVENTKGESGCIY